jgi:hypothetical protein
MVSCGYHAAGVGVNTISADHTGYPSEKSAKTGAYVTHDTHDGENLRGHVRPQADMARVIDEYMPGYLSDLHSWLL